MKRCIEEHAVPSFGTIPVGSLWADDSPFVLDEHAAKFVAVVDEVAAEEPAPKPTKKAATRKFGEKVSD